MDSIRRVNGGFQPLDWLPGLGSSPGSTERSTSPISGRVRHHKHGHNITRELDEPRAAYKQIARQFKRCEQSTQETERQIRAEQARLSQKPGLRAARELREVNRLLADAQKELAQMPEDRQRLADLKSRIADMRQRWNGTVSEQRSEA